MYRCGARLVMRALISLDKPYADAVAKKLGGSKQSGRAGTNNKDFTFHRKVSGIVTEN